MSGSGWVETLRRFNDRKKAEKKEKADGAEQSSPSETELFTKYYNEWKGTGKGNTKNYDAIPRFYFKVKNYKELFAYTIYIDLLDLTYFLVPKRGNGPDTPYFVH